MKQLKNDPVGKIRHLTNEKLQEYQELINDRHPSLQDGCDTIDWWKVRIEASPDGTMQSRFYNSWKSGH